MNLQQLEYILAVHNHRHFARAAEHSFVTQPTLSMMIQKLEEELSVKIFDRSKHPVTPTKEGAEIIERAKKILTEVERLKEYTKELKGEISGKLHLGIIPTLAPYIIPLFVKSFSHKYPGLKIYIKEMVTDDIIIKLKTGEIDIGLLATPLNENSLKEYPLFYEEFFVYASSKEEILKKNYVLPIQIDPSQLWLLEEGHCMRNQIFNLCELKKAENSTVNLHYEAGSIETLINLVDQYEGITIIPHLAFLNLSQDQKKNVRAFSDPKPVREISLVVSGSYPRKQLLAQLNEAISQSIPFEVKSETKSVIPVVKTLKATKP